MDALRGSRVAALAAALLAGCGGGGFLPGLDPDELFDGSFGAIARGSNGTYGVGTGSSVQDAQLQAVQQCQGKGGLDGQPGLADCHD